MTERIEVASIAAELAAYVAIEARYQRVLASEGVNGDPKRIDRALLNERAASALKLAASIASQARASGWTPDHADKRQDLSRKVRSSLNARAGRG